MNHLQGEEVVKQSLHVGATVYIKEEVTEDDSDIESVAKEEFVSTELVSMPSDVSTVFKEEYILPDLSDVHSTIKEEIVVEPLLEHLEHEVFCTKSLTDTIIVYEIVEECYLFIIKIMIQYQLS